MHYSQFTPEQSQNFKAWFGKSVVKDGKNPRICYHGSPDDIKFFDPKFTGKGMDASGIGFYFTSDSSDADRYIGGSNDRSKDGYGGNVMPVYLRIQKPINFDRQPNITATAIKKILSGVPKAELTEFLGDNYDIESEGFYRCYNDYVSALVGTELVRASFSLYNDVFSRSSVSHKFPALFMKATGRDGIIRENSETVHYIVFTANQIKSAVGNNGNFTLSLDDLTK